MAFKEVQELRQQGKLEEALSLANQDLEADAENIWNKRSIAWVYYDYLKANSSPEKVDAHIKILQKLNDLKMPADEEMVFDMVAFKVGKLVYAMSKQKEVDYTKLDEIFKLLQTCHFPKPSNSYSFIYKAFHRHHDNWNRYLEFADWWDFENFQEEDFNESEYEDQKIMPLVEQAYIAYSKVLLVGESTRVNGIISIGKINKEKVEAFLPKLDRIIELYPSYKYPPYYKAKLLMALGNTEKTLSALIPFAKKNGKVFWVWDLLGDVYKDDEDKRLACLCKAMTCPSPEKMLVCVKEKLLKVCLKKNFYEQAKRELDDIIEIRTQQEWKISQYLCDMKADSWYKEARQISSNKDFYFENKDKAEALLFGEIDWNIAVIDSVNKQKKIAHFVASKREMGVIKYGQKGQDIRPGEFIEVKLEKRKAKSGDDYYFPIMFKKTDKEDNSLMKRAEGTPRQLEQKKIAFLEDAIILPYLYDTIDWESAKRLSGKAVINFNQTKGEWGWKVVSVESLAM